jgi:hypothetical protein
MASSTLGFLSAIKTGTAKGEAEAEERLFTASPVVSHWPVDIQG